MSLEQRFERAQAEFVFDKPRTIGLSSGEAGSGKTSFWLGAPTPILVQSLDKGLEGVVERFAKGRTIYTAEYNWSPGADDFSQHFAQETRDKIIADYIYALENGVRTIVWDKETDIWEVFRYAEFGKPSAAPKDYAKLNQRYMSIINKSKDHPVNFGLIQGMKNEWGTSETTGKPTPTGRRVRSGFDRLDEIVFTEILHRRESGVFTVEFGKVRQNTHLQGQKLTWGPSPDPENPRDFADYAGFGGLLLPNTKSGDWK